MTREEAREQLILFAGTFECPSLEAVEMAIEALQAKTDGDLISRQALCQYALNQKDKSVTPNDIMRFPSAEPKTVGWIPVSEGLPKEHEWIGTKAFGTTISDEVLVTFDVDGTRFVKPLSLQNGKLSRPDAQTMDAFHKGWKMLAWMPKPEPYKGDEEK